jgi:hypothetical protein
MRFFWSFRCTRETDPFSIAGLKSGVDKSQLRCARHRASQGNSPGEKKTQPWVETFLNQNSDDNRLILD